MLQAAALLRSVTALRNFTEAISRLSTSSVVLVCSTACITSSGTAVIRPKAVQFIATEMPAGSRLALSARLTVATLHPADKAHLLSARNSGATDGPAVGLLNAG